jgi:hypothetical protein
VLSRAALWVGMAICIPTYQMGASLIEQGSTMGLAMAAILIGNLVILVPLLLNAHPGTRYGIPFPVLLRASFGVLGANVPALMRAPAWRLDAEIRGADGSRLSFRLSGKPHAPKPRAPVGERARKARYD